MRRIPLLATLATLALLTLSATPAIAGTRTSGYYDHKVIEYVSSTSSVGTLQEALLITKGNIVYHIVDSTGNVPAVQCALNVATFPADATDCNVLNFIPTEVGYQGGAWNLQIFHWFPNQAIVALTKDDDITAAAAAGRGRIEVTNILVRCPLVNFSALR